MSKSAPIRWSALAGACVVLLIAGCSERRAAQSAEQGNTYLVLGNVEQASSAFARALELDPKNGAAKLGQARCLWLTKEAEPALKAYKEAVALDPSLDKAYIEGVRAALALKDTATAEDLSSQYAARKPELGGVLHATVLRDTDRVSEAVAELKRLRDAYPASVEVCVSYAGALIAANDPALAEKELKTVLDSAKDSLPARMMLVEAYRAQGKLAEIEGEFRALAKQRPDDDAVQLSLARTLLASGKLDEAETIARPILEKTPESPWANFVIGAYLLAKGKRDDAVTCLEAAAGALPNDPQIAKLLSDAQSGAQASALDQRPAATPASSGPQVAVTWQSLWNDASLKALLRDRETFAATKESNVPETIALAAVFAQDLPVARQAAEGLPADSPVAKYIAALFSRDAKQLKDALDSWQEAVPDRRILRENAEGFALAVFGARAQALRVYSQCLQEFPDNGVAFYNVASMFRSGGMPKFAIGTLKQLITRHGNNREARQALFDTLLEAGLEEDARRQAESTFALFPDDAGAMLNLARVYRDAGESALAEEVLRKGMDRVTDRPELPLALTELLLARGEIDKAGETLASVSDSSAFKQQRLLLAAMIAAARTQWDTVLAHCAEAAGANYPVPTRLLHAAALVKAGKAAEAGETLRAADGQPIVGPSTNVLLRALGVTTDELDKDSESLASALKAEPEALSMFAYAAALRDVRFMRDAATMFRAVDEKVPGQPRLVEFALNALARAGEAPDRAEAAKRFTEKYPNMATAWSGLADMQGALKDPDAQKASLEKAAAVEPANDQPWRRLAHFHSERFDYPALLDASRHVLDLMPEDPYAANNLAYCILQTGGDAAEALTLAQKAYERLPRNAEVLHTLGLAQVRTGDAGEARKNLTAALEMRPGDPTLMLDYGRLLIDQNEADEGKNTIRLALRYTDQLGLDFPRRAEAEESVGKDAK